MMNFVISNVEFGAGQLRGWVFHEFGDNPHLRVSMAGVLICSCLYALVPFKKDDFLTNTDDFLWWFHVKNHCVCPTLCQKVLSRMTTFAAVRYWTSMYYIFNALEPHILHGGQCIQNNEFCMKKWWILHFKDELCIKHDEFRIKNDELLIEHELCIRWARVCGICRYVTSVVFKMMKFAFNMMNVALKMMNFASTMMNFALKMMNFAELVMAVIYGSVAGVMCVLILK